MSEGRVSPCPLLNFHGVCVIQCIIVSNSSAASGNGPDRFNHVDKFIQPHDGVIQKGDRQRLNGHKSAVVWFTGLPGSGKSTLACRLEEKLFRKGIRTFVIDGDNVRTGLNRDLGFSAPDREENIRRIGEVAKTLRGSGDNGFDRFYLALSKGQGVCQETRRQG